MAEAAAAGELSAGEEDLEATDLPRRRGRTTEVQEFVDDLAKETKRTTLLERVEEQLKGRSHVSRILFSFGLSDPVQAAVEQEFGNWRRDQEQLARGSLSGFLLFMHQTAVHFLEGPTELLFSALAFFNSLAAEAQSPLGGRSSPAQGGVASPALSQGTAAGQRAALVNPLRVLYFTELKGVRASTSWCSYAQMAKPQAGATQAQLDESSSSELVFLTYKKFLFTCLKVTEHLSGKDASASALRLTYKKYAEMLPSIDEVLVLTSKGAAEFFFSYPEFEQAFVAPLHLVLHSELLWPMPPSLSY